jgi:hypothetical protein
MRINTIKMPRGPMVPGVVVCNRTSSNRAEPNDMNAIIFPNISSTIPS